MLTTGNLFGCVCVLPRARHAEVALEPLAIVSDDGLRREAVVAVVLRGRGVRPVDQARRVQAAGAAGLVLINEEEGQPPPDWRDDRALSRSGRCEASHPCC